MYVCIYITYLYRQVYTCRGIVQQLNRFPSSVAALYAGFCQVGYGSEFKLNTGNSEGFQPQTK